MWELQYAPGIPNPADQGNPNVPLVGEQQYFLNDTQTHTHTHTHIYIYIYI